MPFTMFSSQEKLADPGGIPSPSFYRFISNLFNAAGGGGVTQSITVGSSPFIYTASQVGQAIVKGGTVSKVEFSRDGSTYFDTGVIAGMFLLNGQDQLRVTYSGKPTMTWVPK